MTNAELAELVLITAFPTIIGISFLYNTFLKPRRRKAFNRIRARGISALKSMSWQDFERFCGLYFERHGYKVKLCGLGGADGGLDLILRKRGRTIMVQCKHWKGKVSVTTVREMFGVMHANRYDGVIIVALTGYTKEAHQWAKGKPITLMTGADLLN
jgi:restriction system protein